MMIPAVCLIAICCLHSLVLGNKAPGKCAIRNDRLDCKRRGLDQVPSLQNVEKLSQADFSDNKLTQLKSKTFERFTSLTILNLAQNMIVDIKPGAFTGLSKLRVLNLSGNQLTKFDLQHVVPLISLKTLFIHNNKFHCDCSFESLAKFIKKAQKKESKFGIPKADQIKCLGPNLVKGKPLVSLSKKLLCDVNECETNSHGCSKFGSCINTGGSYKCVCKKGFTGNGKECRDVNECAMVYRHKCNPKRAFCANTEGSYKCFCRNGFVKKSGRCHDVDECTTGLHKCGSHAVCSNNVGSYRCTCQDGYHGDGYTCIKAKDVRQAGIDPRYIAFGFGVMIVWPILLLSAYYWIKKPRQAKREKGHKLKKVKKRRFRKFLKPADDLEKGDLREVVIYAKESKSAGAIPKEPKDTGSTQAKRSEVHDNQTESFAKRYSLITTTDDSSESEFSNLSSLHSSAE